MESTESCQPFCINFLMHSQMRACKKCMKLEGNIWVPDKYLRVARALYAVHILKSYKNVKKLYKLTLMAISHEKEIDYLLKKLNILEDNGIVDYWSARVMITDMLWGKQWLVGSSLPVQVLQSYEEDLRESFVEVMTIFPNPENSTVATPLPTYVRINTLLISIEKAIQYFINEGWELVPRNNTYLVHLKVLADLEGYFFMRDYHLSTLLVFPPGTSFYTHPGVLNGLFILQDKGSCFSSFLLNPRPDSFVIDLFAGPGIKTNHIANIMKNKGIIYANDIRLDKCTSLRDFMQLTDVKNVKIMMGDYITYNFEDVNHILVDYSSTQSGIFFKTSINEQTARVKRHKLFLSRALRYSLQSFPNVKRVVYTVCSIFPEECEQVVDDALKEVGDSYYLLDSKKMLWDDWSSTGSLDYNCGSKCLRTIPEVDLCQGHFVAVFERNFNVSVPPYVHRTIVDVINIADDSNDVDEDVIEVNVNPSVNCSNDVPLHQMPQYPMDISSVK